ADLRAAPVRDADVPRLACIDDLCQRTELFLERNVVVPGVALVEVDEVHPQPIERGVDLLEDLLARQAAAAVRRWGEDLRRDDVRVARAARERLPEDFLGAPRAVDVRSVEEVDPELERDVDEPVCGIVGEAAAERRPRPEADLRDAEIAVA